MFPGNGWTRRSAGCVLLGLLVAPGLAQDTPDEPPPAPPQRDPVARRSIGEAIRRSSALVSRLRSLGNWEEHHGYMVNSMQEVFERNGWTSEEDEFALNMVSEVEAIPPWNMVERFDAMTRIMSDRYLLDEQQEQAFRRMVSKVASEVLSKHGERIMEYAGEVIDTRAAGRPIEAEQVAHWVELARPVMEDVRQRVETAAEGFMGELSAEQREIFTRDLRAADRRFEHLRERSDAWQRGEWSPEDWGLSNDPIQTGTRRPAGEAPAAGDPSEPSDQPHDAARPSIEPPPPRARPPRLQPPVADPDADTAEGALAEPDSVPDRPGRRRDARPAAIPGDEWSRYVADSIRRFHLNDAQQNSAWKVYRDLADRRDALLRKARPSSAAPAAAEKPNEKLTADVQRLFDDLKRRIDRIPTRAQRRAAESADAAAQPRVQQRESAKP
ncbi:MAG: hypothetical protein CHACPFDD_01054 [Phycisphaerae bacterium]|nr:hypothetical protein [Phycisphaerae bacterium]